MQRIGWFVAVVMTMGVVAGCPITQSQDVPNEILTRRDNVTGAKYYLYVPSSYDGKNRVPLVMTLHGTWPWDQSWMQIREWVALAEEEGFIVVAPRMSDISTQGITPVSDSIRTKRLANDDRSIMAIRREMLTRYRIHPKQVILTGSFGGQVDIDAILEIGMIPPVKKKVVQTIANGAGFGAAEGIQRRRDPGLLRFRRHR